MSDIEKVLARMAQMESELSTLRAQARTPAQPAFDEKAFFRQFVTDPVGTMTKYNIPVDHVTRAGVAHIMGDQAPPQFQMAASMGPVVSTTRDLASSIEAISRRLDAQDQRDKTQSTRASLQKLISDKSKYPHLAKAYAADPSLFDGDVAGHGGSAEDLASALEARQAKLAAAYGVKLEAPAASADAENTQAQSQESKPANVDVTSGGVPQLPQSKGGLFGKDDHEKLKEEILRKYNLQA